MYHHNKAFIILVIVLVMAKRLAEAKIVFSNGPEPWLNKYWMVESGKSEGGSVSTADLHVING